MKTFMAAVATIGAAFAMLMGSLVLAPPDQVAAATQGKGIVYLIRGGANIFSTGMDEIAEKLDARGVDARSLGHSSWREIAREAADRYKKKRQPIVLVGHSFGANAAVLVADELAKSNVPVALVILFDPTTVMQAPANVKRLVNFYSSTVQGMNLEVVPGHGFAGKLENVEMPDVGHLEIDNDTRLHDRVIADVLKLYGLRNRAAAVSG